jgi:hypothetical protein
MGLARVSSARPRSSRVHARKSVSAWSIVARHASSALWRRAWAVDLNSARACERPAPSLDPYDAKMWPRASMREESREPTVLFWNRWIAGAEAGLGSNASVVDSCTWSPHQDIPSSVRLQRTQANLSRSHSTMTPSPADVSCPAVTEMSRAGWAQGVPDPAAFNGPSKSSNTGYEQTDCTRYGRYTTN